MILINGATANVTAWIYLALHGTYGLLWLAKSRFFGDRQWERQTGLGYGLLIWLSLSAYWVSPWLITTGRSRTPPPWYLALCISLYVIGVFLHFAADLQKDMWLEHRPGELLTGGLWGVVRNPNFLGELLIYLGFSLLPMHWAPLLVLALFMAGVWIPNMRRKDQSLSRYPAFADYKARTRLLIPWVW